MKNNIITASLIVCMSFFFIAGCSKDNSSKSPSLRVSVLSGEDEISKLNLSYGQSVNLTAVLKDKNGNAVPGVTTAWTCTGDIGMFDRPGQSNTNFVVNNGVEPGNYIMTADCNGIKKKITVTVSYVAVYDLVISGLQNVTQGQTVQYNAVLYKDSIVDTDDTLTVTWSVSPYEAGNFVGSNSTAMGENVTFKAGNSYIGSFELRAASRHKTETLIVSVS